MSEPLRVSVRRASVSAKIQFANPLPHVIRTPSGLALLEIQGTINLPENDDRDAMRTGEEGGVHVQETPVGRLAFDGYDGEDSDNSWMKKVYLYVGKHQRMSGEVKKLPKAIAILRKKKGENTMEVDAGMDGTEELEVVEIVKYKIIFSTRPEPVGTWAAGV